MRRMPPTSSPVPRLSSAPSDASTVHTIASGSPLRPLVSALMERDGRPPRPLLGDAIATTSPHLAADRPAEGQRLDGLQSSPPRPLPRPLFHVIFPPSGGKDGKAKEQTEQEEREPWRRIPPPSSPVPLFCLLPSPSTPSPVLSFRIRLRFLLFFALISSARSHLFALPSSCSSFLALLPADLLPASPSPSGSW